MDSCITSPRCPVIVKPFPPRILLASMKTISPPTGVHTSPTETPGLLTRSSTSFSRRNFGMPSTSRITSGVTIELVRLALGHSPRLLPHKRCDFAFEVSHARFPRVVVNQVVQRLVREFDLLTERQTVFLGLPRNQEPLRNVDLLLFRVPRKFDHFHAVPQRFRESDPSSWPSR